MMQVIPTPPGTKDNPLYKKCRLVAANSNPAVIIGIPKQIVELGQIIAGEEFKIYMEFTDTTRKHYRIIMEKKQ